MTKRREALAHGADRLRAADVASPDHDAAELLAHVLGVPRGQLVLVDDVALQDEQRFDDLLSRRESREPLQHLTGKAYFRHVELDIGPGAFVPRPETELLAGWAIDAAVNAGDEPVVVDLCTGSGAIARSIADEAPDAHVHAVELTDAALAWAQRNLDGSGVDLRQGDFSTSFDDLIGTVDIVVCNPPYVPLEAWESVAPEARDHDPHEALFSGEDGLDAIRLLERRAAELLKPGGVVGFEHADVQGESAPAVFTATGRWRDVHDHRDLAGRPRFTTAQLAR